MNVRPRDGPSEQISHHAHTKTPIPYLKPHPVADFCNSTTLLSNKRGDRRILRSLGHLA